MGFLGFGGAGKARRRGEEALERARTEALQVQAQRDREASERLAQQERELSEQIFRARREIERVEREKRENEERLRKEQEEMEASLLREHNVAMQMRYDENIADMKQASAQKDALYEESRRREMELIMKNDEKQSLERKEAEARLDKLNATYNKNMEEKNREVLKTKEEMHNEKIVIMQKNEEEKHALQKEHLENLNELQRLFLEQQTLTQEKFENETSILRNDALKREELLREERAEAEQEFQRQMKEHESMSKEERIETQRRHEEYIKSKDAALETLRDDTERRMDDLQEANRVQQAKDIATLQEIQNERIEREKEVHAQMMEIQRRNQEEQAALHEKMLEVQDKAHSMLFLAMKQRQDDVRKYQQILSAIPRALASEQQTSKLMSLKTKLHEIASNTDDSIVNFEQAYGDFKNKSSPHNCASLEKAATDMNECAKTLNRTVTETIAQIDACTSVLAATRSAWRGLLRQLQTLTSTFSRTCTKMIGLTKRKTVTVESIDSLTDEFEKIKDQIYDLPNLDEGSVMGMIEQKQAQIVQIQQNRMNMLSLGGGTSYPAIQGTQ